LCARILSRMGAVEPHCGGLHGRSHLAVIRHDVACCVAFCCMLRCSYTVCVRQEWEAAEAALSTEDSQSNLVFELIEELVAVRCAAQCRWSQCSQIVTNALWQP